MIKSAVLPALVLLAVTSLVNADSIPETTNMNEPPPECPLPKEQLKRLKELTYTGLDGEEMLIEYFMDLWSTLYDYECYGIRVYRAEGEDMLTMVSIGTKVSTQETMKLKQYLQKIEENVYLIRRKDDMKPVGRLYIMFARKVMLVTFQCYFESEKKVTSDQPNDAGGEKKVTSDQPNDAEGEKKVTSDQPNDAEGEKKVTSDQPNDAEGEKKVTSDQPKDAEGEKKVTSDQPNDAEVLPPGNAGIVTDEEDNNDGSTEDSPLSNAAEHTLTEDDLPSTFSAILLPFPAINLPTSDTDDSKMGYTYRLVKKNKDFFGTMKWKNACILHDNQFKYSPGEPDFDGF